MSIPTVMRYDTFRSRWGGRDVLVWQRCPVRPECRVAHTALGKRDWDVCAVGRGAVVNKAIVQQMVGADLDMVVVERGEKRLGGEAMQAIAAEAVVSGLVRLS